jgi:hypothetical protein
MSGQNIYMTGMVILVSTAPLEDSIPSNGAVLTSFTILLVLMFCTLTEQYLLVLPFLSYRSSVTTGMVILVRTASLVDRRSV